MLIQPVVAEVVSQAAHCPGDTVRYSPATLGLINIIAATQPCLHLEQSASAGTVMAITSATFSPR